MSFFGFEDELEDRRGRQLLRRASFSSSERRDASAGHDNRVSPRAIDRTLITSLLETEAPRHSRVQRGVTIHSPPSPPPSECPEIPYLPLEEGEIRVLRVIAGHKRAKVRCEMDHMSLDSPRPYIAVSYAWGDIYDTVAIEINNGIYPVTKSLYGALKAVREPDRDVLVWADAVCIDQIDADERSEQVQRMFLIYRAADLVGIWLGPEADNSDHAIDLIDRLDAEARNPKEVKRIINSNSWEKHFDALVDLFERDYWRRFQIRRDFKPDYKSSPEKLYCDIVEYVLRTTRSLSIICEAHHLSPGSNSLRLPSWVPDWSKTRLFAPLGKNSTYWRGSRFRASGSVEGDVQLLGTPPNKLQMRAIYLGSVIITGNPLSNVVDQRTTLTALIDWWSIFIKLPDKDVESFCRTITLDQFDYKVWTSIFCHVIGTLATYGISSFQRHPELRINPSMAINRQGAEVIFERELRPRLMDHRLFVTEYNDLGLARGTFDQGCVVCIPLGCNTPVILRPDGNNGEYVFHGDAYVDGFMYGKAVELWRKRKMALRTYTLH
ncbi:hypothetical protein E8E14_001911 [Neopestalotiopsis sp. 37M]|nr:hypothetical protein E8E14_001911 [Neopestalotiopsis sp. 37M]